MLTRRGLVRVLGGLIAAPAIVPVGALMPIRGVPLVDPAVARLAGNAQVIAALEGWLLRARAGELNAIGLVGMGPRGVLGELQTSFTVARRDAYGLAFGLDHLRGEVTRQVLGDVDE